MSDPNPSKSVTFEDVHYGSASDEDRNPVEVTSSMYNPNYLRQANQSGHFRPHEPLPPEELPRCHRAALDARQPGRMHRPSIPRRPAAAP